MGASLDSDFVLSVGVENCHNFTFIGNSIIASVNNRPAFTYPTLDCFLISKCDNSSILNNSIYMTDFLTFPGVKAMMPAAALPCHIKTVMHADTMSAIATGEIVCA